MLGKIFALIFLLATTAFTVLGVGGKVEAIGAFTDKGASESVRNAVEAKGYRVTFTDGSACEIWLRKAVPTRAKTDVSGAIYTEIVDSAVVAVISLPKGATDFRGQPIKPGSYTLRYALHPSDGNHLGISPYRDFLLLVPVGVDQNVDTQYKFEDLVKMSAKAIGGNHPAPLSLVSPDAKAAAPGLVQNEHSHLVFVAKVKSSAGADLPIAFIVKGVAEQ